MTKPPTVRGGERFGQEQRPPYLRCARSDASVRRKSQESETQERQPHGDPSPQCRPVDSQEKGWSPRLVATYRCHVTRCSGLRLGCSRQVFSGPPVDPTPRAVLLCRSRDGASG